MKTLLATALLATTLSAHAGSTPPTASVTYRVALQNEFGVHEKTVTLPVGAGARRLGLAGGVVEIQPPATADGESLLKLYTADGTQPVLLHTAHVGAGQPVRVGYTVCGRTVRFQSPAPDRLAQCPAVAGR